MLSMFWSRMATAIEILKTNRIILKAKNVLMRTSNQECVVCVLCQSVIVKSVERNALNMYEARRCLLGLDSSGVSVASGCSNPPLSSPALSCPVGLDILASTGLGLSSLGKTTGHHPPSPWLYCRGIRLSLFCVSPLGLLGPTTASMTGPSSNSLLNALNSSISPLQTPISGTPSPSLWSSPTSTAGTHTGTLNDTYF